MQEKYSLLIKFRQFILSSGNEIMISAFCIYFNQ